MKKILLLILFVPIYIVTLNFSHYVFDILLNLLVWIGENFVVSVETRNISDNWWWYEIVKYFLSLSLALQLGLKVYPYENKLIPLIILSIVFLISFSWTFFLIGKFPEIMSSLSGKEKTEFILSVVGYSGSLVFTWVITLKGKGDF